MPDLNEVSSQVGLAALLDTDWLHVALADQELLDDAALWAPVGDGPTDMLASHPLVTRLIAAAITSPRAQVRATVAARPDLDCPIYVLLGDDEHPLVRFRVASNPATPRVVIARLTDDADPAVREAAEAEAERRWMLDMEALTS
jgi:hypothetical protein